MIHKSTLNLFSNGGLFSICGSARTCAIVLATLVATTARSEQVEFKFNPPDGTSVIETIRHIKETQGFGVTSTQEQKVRYSIRSTDEGYAVTMTPADELSLEEAADRNPSMTSLLAHARVVYDLTPEGQLIRVRGLEELEERILQVPQMEEFLQILDPIAIQARDFTALTTNHWNSRMLLGLLVGQTLELGSSFSGQSQIPLPGGRQTQVESETEISGWVECGTHQCVKITTSYTMQDSTIAESMMKAMNDLWAGVLTLVTSMMDSTEIPSDSTIPKTLPFSFSDVIMTGTVERLLDPNTGLIYGETSERLITATAEMLGEKREGFWVKERQECRYVYE